MRRYAFRLGAYRLRIAWLPAAAALALLALMLWAGFWQLERADEKRRVMIEQTYRGTKPPVELSAQLPAAAEPGLLRHRRALARGRYLSDRQYLLDNRTHEGVAGYHVLTPLRLEGSRVLVLVNRGWVPVGADRTRLPDVAVGSQVVSELGLITAPPGSGLALGPAGYADGGWPRVIQRVDLERMRAQLDAPLLPFVLRLSSASAHGYVREWQSFTDLSPERHLGYAVQWFAMAAALLGLCFFVSLRRAPGDAHEE